MTLNGKLKFWRRPGSSGDALITRPAGQLSALNGIVETAFNDSVADEIFIEAGGNAAEQAGCKLLFEIPAVLLEGQADRVAAVHSGRENGEEMFFLVLDTAGGTVSVVRQEDVPPTVIEFTRSYAGVLSMIANDSNLTRPLIQ